MSLVLGACAGAPPGGPAGGSTGTELRLRGDWKSTIIAGEECVYGVAWGGFLPVGRVTYRTRIERSEGGEILVYDGITEPAAYVTAFLDAGGTTKVHVDPVSLLPVTAFWVTADPDDPISRAVWFDRAAGAAWSAKWTRTSSSVLRATGPDLIDPLSAIYLARVLDFRPEGTEHRLLVVEGDVLHLMTMTAQGSEDLVHDGRQVRCERVAVRTFPFGDDGKLAGTEPENSIDTWVAEEDRKSTV